MGLVSVLNTAFASIALFTCILQLFLSLKRKGDLLSLFSLFLSFTVFLRFSMVFLCSSPVTVAEHHLALLRCQLILTQVVFIFMLGEIFFLLKDPRKLILYLNIIVISLLAILCLIMPDVLLFGNKEVVYLPNIANAENMAMIGKGFTLWRAISDLSVLLFSVSMIMLLIKKLGSENHKKITALLAGTVLVILSALYDQLVDLGLLNSTYLLPIALFIFYMILNFIPYLFLLEEVAENMLISQREQKWRNLVYDVNVIVVGLNRMGHVEFINPYFQKLTGFQEDEVLDKDWFEFFIPPKEFYKVQGAFIEALESDFHFNYINPIITKSKEERIIRWYNVRTRDINGKITGSLSIGMDITEDLREKEDITNQLQEAQALIKRLQDK
jgi:PAS domain S-box-containing protein